LNMRRLFRAMLVLSFVIVLSACVGMSKPTVVIVSPPSGSTFDEGEAVKIQSTSNDSAGITRVELIIDNEVVKIDPSPSAQGQPTFALIQIWKATPGAHIITVQAYNTAGAASVPAAIAINVPKTAETESASNVAIAPNATLTPSSVLPNPTLTPVVTSANVTLTPAVTKPNASPSAAVSVDTECTDNSVYIGDVTVPDGTNFNSGQSFTKTWRVSNNGNCVWDTGYQFVFVKGEAMAATTVIPVPKTLVGTSVELSVPMTAPATSGAHTGQWKLRNADGSLFGQSVTVKINVTSPAPPATGCVGTPNIASFAASPKSITSGNTTTLSWGAVSNADSIEIDNGIGGQASPGSVQVSPGSDTIYTLTAHCGANTSTAQTTIAVTPAVKITSVPVSQITPIRLVTIPAILLLPKVTSVAIQAVPYMPATCSRMINFLAIITTNGATTVAYKFEHDDGRTSPQYSIKFDGAETKKTLAYVYTATKSDSNGTVQVHVTAPNNIKSSTATYSCTK
jgi:hypothetical protein